MLLLPAGQAFAVDITVEGGCTLSGALFNAYIDSDSTGGLCPAGSGTEADTIILTKNETGIGFRLGGEVIIEGKGFSISAPSNCSGNCRLFTTSGSNPDATFKNLTLAGGSHSVGGIIYTGDLKLTIIDSVVRDNRATRSNTQDSGSGGAINMYNTSELVIENSAFYNNSVPEGSASGGAIYFTGNKLTIINSTFFNNSAANQGGAIATVPDTGKPSVLIHVTVTGNTAPNGGAGVRFGGGGAGTTLKNSIIYGNTGNDCDQTTAIAEVDNNIIGTGNCGGSPSAANPRLSSSTTSSPPYYTFREDSPAKDAATCISGVTTDQRGAPRPQGSLCDIGAYEGPGHPSPVNNAPSSGSGGDDEESDADDDSYKAPPPSTCLTLDGIKAYNISESTQCQRVNAMQIANPAIKDGDFVEAVDVWGWVTPNSEICFEAAGSAIKFIDTAAMPRTAHDLEAYTLNGMVCALINGPGIVVLLPGDPPPARAEQSAQIASQSLSGCMVTATASLNLRMSPGGAVIGGVPEGWTLTALERTSGWFKVDRLGTMGWISADWVEQQGNCG